MDTPTDLDLLLRSTADVDPDPRALVRGRAALDAALDAAADRSTRFVALKRRRHRRTTLVGLVAAAAAVVVAVPAMRLGGHPSAKADAAQVLRQAGRAAGAQPGDWRGAAYWHSVSRHSQDGGPVLTREIWIGHSRSGVLKDEGVNAPALMPLGVASFPAGGSSVSWDGLWQLPTDARALEARLRSGIDGAGPDDDSELFTIVGDLLRESPAPPALRKALWEVASGVPGVELEGATTDAAGRSGVAVSRHGQRYVLDPDTGRLLEESSASWVSTYLSQGPTETAPAATWVEPAKG